MSVSAGVRKYLARWAEPEANQLPAIPGRFFSALVVPAFAESPALLDGFRRAGRAARGRMLVVLVVNTPSNASAEQREQNAALLAELRSRAQKARAQTGHAFMFFAEEPEFSLLVIDRASEGREIQPKLGVGHARKLGADCVVALAAADALELPFVFSSDADASLPPDYFERAEVAAGDAAALLYPFEHVQLDAGADVFEATRSYELSIRYHVLGLAAAGSPYAYHSIGSTLAARVESYAAVRGFPKRAAGEDFYLLDKLGKIGAIRRLPGAPIGIRARRSLRVPFGTGPRVERVLQGDNISVDHPNCYAALARLLRALDQFAVERDDGVFTQAFADWSEIEAAGASAALESSGVAQAARAAANEVGGGDLRRRLHTWFDALRSLRFLHALGERTFPELAYREALALAPFARIASDLPLEAAVSEAIRLEATLPQDAGPALVRLTPARRS
ncbi:MAG: hypothetical protein ACOY0T_08520 [Myxococcota bacterium]